jgi:hypothetical protein
MATPDSSGLSAARSALRARQATYVPTHSQGADVTAAALDAFEELTRFAPDESSDRVRRGAFTYVRELELNRIARGESLIRRVQPGPFEDPNYFALLAYQAASLELAWDRMAPAAPKHLFSSFLLGTAHEPEVNAVAIRVHSDDYRLVLLNSGLVDFVYQAAKVIVAAASPQRSTEGHSLVRATFGPQSAVEHLKTDPEPAERLYRTLEAYFFGGYPRASAFEIVPMEQHPPLALLVSLAERWIIGHEYGHGIAPPVTNAPPGVNLDIAEEYFADCSATTATVLSAALLDAVPPEFPLASAIFALGCLDVLQRAHRLVRTGTEDRSEKMARTHPEPCDRAHEVVNCFKRFFDVQYLENNLFDLDYGVREAAPENHGFTEARRVVAFSYADSLRAVWKQVRERLLEDHRKQRPLHPIWGPA